MNTDIFQSLGDMFNDTSLNVVMLRNLAMVFTILFMGGVLYEHNNTTNDQSTPDDPAP